MGVVCVGTPRIHESIVSSNLKGTAQDIKSILLDIDVRLRPFYDSSSSTWGTFCHYNMFNHFFFRDTERDEYLTFLKGNEDVIIITDPPFGGKCELIARSLNIIREDVTKVRNRESTANIMWIFPYYMERQIQQEITDIKMSDYQVCYETKDANSYKDGLETGNSGSRKLGSPVRVFTTLPLENISLPEDSYKFCDKCKIWVSRISEHCAKCNICISKNGGTYWHCNKCQKCVKSTWKHCGKCGRCALPDHPCTHFSKQRLKK